jgi:hypothetical protein
LWLNADVPFIKEFSSITSKNVFIWISNHKTLCINAFYGLMCGLDFRKFDGRDLNTEILVLTKCVLTWNDSLLHLKNTYLRQCVYAIRWITLFWTEVPTPDLILTTVQYT